VQTNLSVQTVQMFNMGHMMLIGAHVIR
jgi:hypothetical protein